MKYALTVIIFALAGAVGYWLFTHDNPLDRFYASPQITRQIDEANQKIAALSSRIDALSLDHERELGKLNGRLVELEPLLHASETESQEEARSLSQEVLELRTQLDSARFRLAQLEELIESYHTATLVVQEKLAETQNQLEAFKEEFPKVKPRKEAAGENPASGSGETRASARPHLPAPDVHRQNAQE